MHPCVARNLARFELVAHHRDVFGARTDKGDLVVAAGLSKSGTLGEKTVTGMKSVAAGALGRGNEILNFQVAIGGARRADANGAVGHLRRHAFAVCIGNRRNRLDTKALTSSDDPHSDLAAVCDQDSGNAHSGSWEKTNIVLATDHSIAIVVIVGGGFNTRPLQVAYACWDEVEICEMLLALRRDLTGRLHYGLTMNNGWPNSTNWPFCTTNSTIVPLTVARTLLKTFMTSINPQVVSSVICWPTLTKGGAPGSGAT